MVIPLRQSDPYNAVSRSEILRQWDQAVVIPIPAATQPGGLREVPAKAQA
jgi:hypothetical protein